MFNQSPSGKVDAYIAMYHDQGLAPFKIACFGSGVNVTLGLPFIRTSVDHGTALSLAGKEQAEIGSMFSAIELAYQKWQKMAHQTRKRFGQHFLTDEAFIRAIV
jgi:4-hydroxythreonine-4-phosphate dehydrogenase